MPHSILNIFRNLTPPYEGEETIDPEKIVDLTDKMDSEGKLEWEVPAGEWVIMRFARQAYWRSVETWACQFNGIGM